MVFFTIPRGENHERSIFDYGIDNSCRVIRVYIASIGKLTRSARFSRLIWRHREGYYCFKGVPCFRLQRGNHDRRQGRNRRTQEQQNLGVQ